MLALSEGTAARLGLRAARMDCYPTTAYLLVGERCKMACAFCARRSLAPTARLGRVGWPRFEPEDIFSAYKNKSKKGPLFERVCLQAVRGEGGVKSLLPQIALVRERLKVPLSVSTWIGGEDEAGLILDAGAERVSIALDAASEGLYRRYKGGSFRQRLDLLLRCSARWPQRLTTHLIAGLGESEEEMLALIEKLFEANITVALFAFTPLKGTPLAGQKRPDLDAYRRLQAAFFLLRQRSASLQEFAFRNGRLVSLGFEEKDLLRELSFGDPFRTSGCPACNRPYYNESPAGPLYNYHRPLSPFEAEKAFEVVTSSLKAGRKTVC